MVDVSAVLGIVLGGLGFCLGLFTLVYTRGQVQAARKQAEEASRATLLEVNRELAQRMRELRSRVVESPELADKWVSQLSPEFNLGEVVRQAGGPKIYYFIRDMIDTFEDIFYLRTRGIVADELWERFRTQIHTSAGVPSFRTVFDYAVRTKLVQADFARFIEHLLKGEGVPDPRDTNK